MIKNMDMEFLHGQMLGDIEDSEETEYSREWDYIRTKMIVREKGNDKMGRSYAGLMTMMIHVHMSRFS